MQPKFKTNKTLLASALILGLGNAFNASSDTFTVTASTVADVDAQTTTTTTITATELSFGAQIKPNPTAGDTCYIVGASEATEADVGATIDGNNTETAIVSGATTGGYSIGDIRGTGCIEDTAGDQSGSVMLVSINAADSSTVSVSIPDVVGTGWTYSAGAESCVMKYNGGTAADTCETFDSTTSITGVRMQKAMTSEFPANAAATDIAGETRVLVAGTLTFDGTAVSAPAGEQVTITVTYE
jgi:hypothetical protein